MIGLLSALIIALGIYIPGAGTGSSSSVTEVPDWASSAVSDYPAVDMLGGDVSTDNWVQANTIGATDAIDTVAVDTARGAISLYHVSAGAEDAGWLTTAVAGDFCYAIRLGYETDTISSSNMTFQAMVAFVDDGAESVDVDEWFGAGWYRFASSQVTGNNIQKCQGGSPGDHWAGCGSAAVLRETPATEMDYLLKRSGTTLRLYLGTPGTASWTYAATWAVTANAGRIGIRLRPLGAYVMTFYMRAFRRFATCPR